MPKLKTDEEKFRGLRRFNAAMFVLHFVQAILLLIITYMVIGQDVSLPVKSYFLTDFDPVTQTVSGVEETLFSLPWWRVSCSSRRSIICSSPGRCTSATRRVSGRGTTISAGTSTPSPPR